jgi:hypothetical protein
MAATVSGAGLLAGAVAKPIGRRASSTSRFGGGHNVGGSVSDMHPDRLQKVAYTQRVDKVMDKGEEFQRVRWCLGLIGDAPTLRWRLISL